MNIRKIEEKDCNQVIELLDNVGWFKEYLSNSNEYLKNKFIKHIQICSTDNSHTIYIAEYNNEIIGYISVHWLPYLFLNGPEGYISELFIRDEERGKGIGRKLLKIIKEEAKERGCSRLSLLNGKNRESYCRGFYEKEGFIEREKMANFILKL